MTLDANGLFEASMTLDRHWQLVGGAAGVSVTGTEAGALATAAGGTCATTPSRRPSGSTWPAYQVTVTCQVPLGTLTRTTDQPGIETDSLALLGGELTLPLSDGADLDLPMPPGMPGQHEARLTPAYGSAGADTADSSAVVVPWPLHGPPRSSLSATVP